MEAFCRRWNASFICLGNYKILDLWITFYERFYIQTPAPCPSGSNVKKLLLRKLVANKIACGGWGAASWARTMRVMHPLPQDVAYLGGLPTPFACRGRDRRLRFCSFTKDERKLNTILKEILYNDLNT